MHLSQIKLTKKQRLLPILNRSGAYFLVLGIIITLSGIVFNYPFIYSLALNIIVFTLCIAKIAWEYLAIKSLISDVSINFQGPTICYVDRQSNFELQFSFDLTERQKVEVVPVINVICREKISEYTINRESQLISHHFNPIYRGEIILQQINLRFIIPGYLCNWQASLSPVEKLSAKVLPNAFASGLSRNSLYGVYSHMNKLVKNKGYEGREYNGSRKYVVGDNKKSIDWKRSAKLGSLIVKTYRPESHQNIFIAIDTSRRLSLLAEDRIQLDYAIDSAASIIRSTCFQNDEVALLAFHRNIELQTNLKNSNTQITEIISKLTKLQLHDVEPNYYIVNEWLARYRRRGLVILITSFSSPTNVDAVKDALLALPKKHLPLVIAMDNDKLQELSLKKAVNLDDAYIRGAAFEQINAIESKVNQLKKHGIEVVYSNFRDIASLAEKKYWELKLSGKL